MSLYVACLNLTHKDLAIAELEMVFETSVKEVIGRWVVFSCDRDASSVYNRACRLAMVKSIHSILKVAEKNTYHLSASEVIENSYRIDVKHTTNTTPNLLSVADAIYHELDNPIVDLHNPDHEYLILFTEDKAFIAELVTNITEQFFTRKSHRLTFNHPTSINPRFARAMINLSGRFSFLDPFCGVGGILIEGGLLGLDVKGGDISQDMVSKATDNLERFDLDVPVSICDARTWDEPVETIISDLPYGRNSPASESLSDLYSSFFSKASSITDRMIIGCLADFPLDDVLDKDVWKVSRQFDIYTHKSMVRRINIIEKKK